MINLRNISRKRAWSVVWGVLAYLLATMTLAIICYLLFMLFFRTDQEKRLQREIAMYERLYPSLAPDEELIGDAIAGLQHKDAAIYEMVFKSEAPDVNPMAWLEYAPASDTIPPTKLTSYTRDKSNELLSRAASVDENFRKIFSSLQDTAFVMPPMELPLKDISYTQTGASLGTKMDPFYKAYVWHGGIDFIVSRGTPVYAAADGVVSDAYSSQGSGYTIEITHDGNYKTVYAHLENVRRVRKGQKVTVGQEIGTVGMSGKTVAPHLHYEIHRAGYYLDPVNYFFASISLEEYANMLYMAVSTSQSLD